MTDRASYVPVSVEGQEEDDDDDDVLLLRENRPNSSLAMDDDDDDCPPSSASSTPARGENGIIPSTRQVVTSRFPLEVDQEDGGKLSGTNLTDDDDDDDLGLSPSSSSSYRVQLLLPFLTTCGGCPPHLWCLSIALTGGGVIPLLLAIIHTWYSLTGRIWVTTPWVIHLLLAVLAARCQIPSSSGRGVIGVLRDDQTWWAAPSEEEEDASNERTDTDTSFISATTPMSGGMKCFITSLASWFDMILFGIVYPVLWQDLVQYLWTEPDGSAVLEWSTVRQHLIRYGRLGRAAAVLRLVLAIGGVLILLAAPICTRGRLGATAGARTGCPGTRRPIIMAPLTTTTTTIIMYRLQRGGRIMVQGALAASLGLGLWCAVSIWIHFGSLHHEHLSPQARCDPLDATECWLPFPSFFHMREDGRTATGWRVDLQAVNLPQLRGRVPLQPQFLNRLDGFSTMGPMLFYLDGLKEAHQAGRHQLVGPNRIEQSITAQSVTLLLNVDDRVLVPHHAEIDYLDPPHPLVLLFPAAPLFHNRHYAVAVVNATDQYGTRLNPTLGMITVLSSTTSTAGTGEGGDDSGGRSRRYQDLIIPVLELAAPWFNYSSDPLSLQLLFDFVTASETSQLGPVRAVRDGALAVIQASNWQWSDHVRTNRIDTGDCQQPNTLIARTVHAELDVPWFLSAFGPGHRGAFLDEAAVESRTPHGGGVAKFMVLIPCSLHDAALDPTNERSLQAVMEFGHGLFSTRAEVLDDYLQEMAHSEAYVLTAMDWRGMSLYDLPTVVKSLLSTPDTFQAICDNLIQGYANKLALQYFSRNGLLDMDWFSFHGQRIPISVDHPPRFVFYGNSQGGILGAGYTALAGPTKLLDRSILGVPGTPFSLVMTRSADFVTYDSLMIRNFYDNRHVRFFLALAQMAWDSVEGAGLLAPPIQEPFPRVLMQAGLGDPVVPTIAAETLARGFRASTLPSAPKAVYGLVTSHAANETWDGPYVTLTELLYSKQLAALPEDNTFVQVNFVHVCVRHDPALIRQLVEFVNTGRVIDPCVEDGCIRDESCF